MNSLLIVASTIARDGTSRFITYLANYLTKQSDIKIKILLFRSISEESRRLLDDKVDVECLNIKNSLISSAHKAIGRILAIKPTYCLFGFHQLLWMSFLAPLFHRYGIRIIIRDTIIPSLFHANESLWRKFLSRKAYNFYDMILAQSLDMQDDLINNWNCDASKVTLINNPVDIDALRASVGSCPEELKNKNIFTFVAAGRLTEQKGYDLIINRMAEMKSVSLFRLIVLGSGELEEELRKLSKDKGVDEYIQFIGYRTNVSSYIYYSDGLLLSSRYEGFPNIVLEANALGKPVFSNNCKGGINEIIVEGENGITCDFNNSIKFKEGLYKFLECKFSATRIIEMTRHRFDISSILNTYITILSK